MKTQIIGVLQPMHKNKEKHTCA